MRNIQHRTTGFTVIELLIVIVVIAILAAITVVAFRGIGARADHTRILTEVKSWSTAFELYRIEKGNPLYIDAGLTEPICLGDSAPAVEVYPANYCMVWHVNGSVAATEHPTHKPAMDMLRAVAPKLPNETTKNTLYTDPVSWPGHGEIHYRGISYSYNGQSRVESLTFYLQGSTDCGSYEKTFLTGMNVTKCIKEIK